MEDNGVDEVEDFLGLSNKELKDLAEKTGISLKNIDKWQEHADLMRIKGVGPEYADLLNQIGIDSVKELAQRNPTNTLERVEEFDKKRPNVVRRLPLLDEIKDWIAQAKKL